MSEHLSYRQRRPGAQAEFGHVCPSITTQQFSASLCRCTWSAVTSCSFAMIGGIACAIAQEGNTTLFSFTERGNKPAPQRHVLWHAVYMWLVGSGDCELVAMICPKQAWRFGDCGCGERNGGDRGNKAEVVWQGNFPAWALWTSCSSSYLIVCFDEGTRTGVESREEGAG